MVSVSQVILVLAAPFVGSFLGSVVLRLPQKDAIVWARSKCASCGHILAPTDLIPVLSWLWNRRRCAHCAARISLFYPVVELAALALALWAATEMSGLLLAASCLFGWTLLVLALIDWRTYHLPDVLTLPLLGAGLLAAVGFDPAGWLDHVIGAVAGFAAFALVATGYRHLRGREGLGLGDAKLVAAIGAWVAWQGLASVILWAAAAAIAATLLRSVITNSHLTTAMRIPFGPFLALGGWLVWLYGPLLIR